jgi:subtilisin family serine protease
MKASRFFNILTALVLTLGLLGGVYQPAAAQTGGEVTRDTLFVPGEVVVGFAEGQTPTAYSAQASALAGTVGAQVVDLYASMALLSFAADADVQALATQLAGQPGVKYAEPNYISWIPEEDPIGDRESKLTEVTRTNQDGAKRTIPIEKLLAMRTIRNGQNVPTYPNDGWNNWGWSYSQADIIWPNTTASPKVCVLDTGADILHPDLKGKVINGYDFVNEDTVPNDDHGHGTHVAGVIVAINNNNLGLAGISNGQVKAVKVLSAQGWGTNFDISKGIRYCADDTTVKVLSMSLGGSVAGAAEYSALQYAINTKGKLVSAAAGNSSMGWNMIYNTAPSFPAGWASPNICPNGTYSGATCNDIYQALLAVGAAGSPFRDPIWVDTDGDGIEDGNESYWNDQCAAWFSNFGKWVQIVAPGQDIWSTTPVTYPFWANQYQDAWTPYDSWSGTSMATPHVSAGAARAWSIYPTKTNAQMKDWLISTGNPITTASDPNVPTLTDMAYGYYGNGWSGDAPYCWPNGYYNHGSFNSWYSMANSKYLNVAAAMGRGGLMASVLDATTGLGIANTTVQAYQGTVLKDTNKNDTKGLTWIFDLINLPAGTGYTLKVTNAFTAGAQTFTPSMTVVSGGYIWGTYSDVGVPSPKNRIAGVLNWWWWGTDLDLYVWLPNGTSIGGSVGPGGSLGPGLFSDFPRARWNRDGGWNDWMALESISIMPKPGYATQPYYYGTGLMPGQGYDFLVTDYGADILNQPMAFRYWVNGAIQRQVFKADVCNNAAGEDWWEPGYVGWNMGPTFTTWDMCGTPAIIPYAEGGGLSGTATRK